GRRTAPGPAHGSATHLPARPAQHAGGLGHQLHALVRRHLLGVPGDPVGVRHRDDRRHLPGLHDPHRDLARQPGGPPPEEDGPAGLRRLLAGALRGQPGRLPAEPARGVPPHRQHLALGVRAAADARGDRRQRPADRAVHPGHAAGPGRRPGQGQRPGGHDDGGVLPRHLGDQRAAGGGRRDALRPADGPGGAGRSAAPPVPGEHPRRPPGSAGGGDGGAGDRRGRRRPGDGAHGRPAGPAGRPARDGPAGPRRPGAAGADRLRLLQQPAGRGVHGPARRLRPVADVGAGLGAALGRAQHRRHHRRAAGGQGRPRHQPGEDPAGGEPRALEHHRPVPPAGVPRGAGRGPVRLHADRALRRGGRADRPAAGRPVRAAGTGVRLRAERRAGGVAADRLPHRPADPVRRHPLDDRRGGCRRHRQLVRHGCRARHRAGLRGDGSRRPGGHAAGPGQPSVPPAEHRRRRRAAARADRAGRAGGGPVQRLVGCARVRAPRI
ncbi:MAG: Multidrug resistance protein, partial [uncultured Friedmanniella sp.]